MYTPDLNRCANHLTMMIAKDGYVKHVTYMVDVRNLYHISAANPRQATMKSKACQKELD